MLIIIEQNNWIIDGCMFCNHEKGSEGFVNGPLIIENKTNNF